MGSLCLHFLEFLFLRSIHYTSVQFEPRPKRERKLFFVVQLVFWWKALKKIDNGAQLKPTQQRKKAMRMSILLSFFLSSCLHLLCISTFMLRRKKRFSILYYIPSHPSYLINYVFHSTVRNLYSHMNLF